MAANEVTEEVVNNLIHGIGQEKLEALRKVRGIDLEDRNLRYANLKGSVMPRANLQNAFLQYADLSGAQLQGANLSGAQLQGANLSGAQLQDANLSEAQSQEINLNGANLQGVNFVRANLEGANLSKAQLQGADFFEAKLHGADFKNANLQGVNLEKAQLQGADLSYAKLQGVNFKNVDLQASILKSAFIGGASFENANLDFSDLRNLNISGFTQNDYLLVKNDLDESINDQKRRLNILQSLFQIIGQQGNINLKIIRSANQCLYDSPKLIFEKCLTNKKDFYRVRTDKLVELVCNNPGTIEYIVIRTIIDQDSALANALLNNNCHNLKAFMDKNKLGKRALEIVSEGKL